MSADDFYFNSLRAIAVKFNVTVAIVNDVQHGFSAPMGTDVKGILGELANAGLRLRLETYA